MVQRQKIGIMGGTFDPIHLGHLLTAEAVRTAYGLDKILFIPAGNPPHKQQQQVTPTQHRYAMTAMAVYSNPYFFVSDIEASQNRLSYTVDTIKYLTDKYADDNEFYFIIGADALRELPTWHDVRRLLTLCRFIAVYRPGSEAAVDEAVAYFDGQGKQHIHKLRTPQIEISATEIRTRVRQGLSIRYMVPDCVANYILQNSLYK